MNDYKDVYQYAKDKKLLTASAIKNKEFRDFFGKVKIKTVVEIGTRQGISATHIAQFARKVFTFDVYDFKRKYKVWEVFGVDKKIYYQTVTGRQEIKEFLHTIKFDFAFIDGKHTYEDVRADFEMVKSCGKVLFHDTAKRKNYGVREFVKEIGAEIEGNIAYWKG